MAYCVTGLRAAWIVTCIPYCSGAKVQGKPRYLQHFKLFCESVIINQGGGN